jgi:hypothetical protein
MERDKTNINLIRFDSFTSNPISSDLFNFDDPVSPMANLSNNRMYVFEAQ